MQKTANQIKSSFELLASGHYQIHSFLYAQEFEQQAYENLIYPLMLVYPLGGNLSGTTYARNYRVIIADRVLKSEGNELEVESDTQLIALDVLAYWMKLGQNERFTITSSNTITPFWEKWGDEVTGHFVDIGIEEFYDFNSCAIPLSGAIPSPVNPCKDARISVNSVVYGNAPSDSNFNVVVKNQSGALVGILIGGEWIVNTGSGCLDSTYTITNSSGATLYTGTIPSGGSITQAISNSTLNVNNSASTLISSRSILAQGTDSYNVADSLIENAAISPTYSQLVKATEGLILPTQSIQNNGVASGSILSVGTINVTTNVPPTSFNVTGRTIDIVVPTGSSPMNVDFIADKLTATIAENITFTDLSNQVPTHWSWRFDDGTTSIIQNPVKQFFSLGFKNITLLAGKVGAGGVLIKNNYIQIIGDADADAFLTAAGITDPTIIQAINALVGNLKNDGIWNKLYALYPMVGGTATTHKFNLKNPLDSNAAFRLVFNGGWTHSTNGATPNGSNAYAETFILPTSVLSINSAHIATYITTNPNNGVLIGNNDLSLLMQLTGVVFAGSLATTSFSQISQAANTAYYMTNRQSGTNQKLIRNSTILISDNKNSSAYSSGQNIFLGAYSPSSNFSNARISLSSIGQGLSDIEAVNYYNAIQTFQTTLGRQV